ncbi:group XV phospholipase A2-like isoform X1 [Centruroides sculpturatus]|uniref:group XV phospholipase A2-like isoform X1 n=2 Tax=Centruroides sculpturatus TaxID=218467 RepID=UPI000C6E6389|nr:group XV phospholipase A2-like isoform X1 [Centruroides sculpturatus]
MLTNKLLSIILFSLSLTCREECAAKLKIVRSPESPSPVVIVPGDGGSQFKAKLNKPNVKHYFCDKKTNSYFTLWLNLEQMIPYILECWVDNMRLVYNNVTRTTSNSPGVDIIIPGFGETSTIEYIDPSRAKISSYFYEIVNILTATANYTRGVNVRGAPYDFRKAPNELKEYYERLKQLIEETYKINKNLRILMICHSLGCPITLYFLNNQTLAWKDKYIKALVTLAAPWGGAVKALKAFASGDNLGVSLLDSLTVRGEERTNPSTAFLLPSNQFWKQDEVLSYTPVSNYTVSNYYKFFQDLKYQTGWDMWLDTHKLIHNLESPGVEIHCLYGTGLQTISQFYYKDMDSFPNSYPELEYGDGDGTVNVRSLRGCLRWTNIFYREYKSIDHMKILQHPPVLDYIRNLAVGN